jgi:hypothetical protein
MIQFDKTYRFSNDFGEFAIKAYTEEHPSDYGNGTLLRFDVESEPKAYGRYRSFDIRYEHVHDADGVEEIVKRIIESDYGVMV